jgi:hypothetical protein
MAPLDAKFQVPEPQEFLRYSRPAPKPEADQSGAILAKGLGEAAADTITGIDKTVEAVGVRKTREEGEAARKREEDRLTAQEAALGIGQSPDENSELRATQFQATETDGSQSLIQKDERLPDEIRYGAKTIGSLKERFNNGKIDQTDYKSEVDRIAKDLHSQFPFHRDAISRELERVTGVAGADAAIQSRVQRINQIMTQLNEQKNKIDSKTLEGLKDIDNPDLRNSILRDHFGKNPGDPGYMDELNALHHVLNAQSRDINQRRIETDLTIDEKQNTVDKIKVGKRVNEAIANTVEDWQHNLVLKNGVKDWDGLMDKVRDIQANPDSVAGQQLANDIASSLTQLKTNLYKNTRVGAKILGPDLDKNLESAGAYFDRLAKDAVGGDVSKLGNIVSSAGNAVAAIQQNAKLGWLREPQFGPALAAYEALNSLSPEVAKTYLETFQNVVKNAGQTIGNHFQETMTKGMSVPPGGAPGAKPMNMNERIQQAHDMGASPQTLQGYINWLDNIKTMPRDKAINTAYMYYGPENIGMLSKWARDAYNWRTGQTAEGQGTILSKMGNKEILDKIWSLNDPKLKSNVQSFLEDAVSNRVFPSLMKDLEGTTKFGLAYDNKTQEFVIRNPKEQAASGMGFPAGTSNYAQATQTIKQLNNIAGVVRNLASHLGKDPNAYMTELITAGNPNVGKELPGTPAQTESAAVRALGNQVLAKKMKEKPGEESNPDSNESKLNRAKEDVEDIVKKYPAHMQDQIRKDLLEHAKQSRGIQ